MPWPGVAGAVQGGVQHAGALPVDVHGVRGGAYGACVPATVGHGVAVWVLEPAGLVLEGRSHALPCSISGCTVLVAPVFLLLLDTLQPVFLHHVHLIAALKKVTAHVDQVNSAMKTSLCWKAAKSSSN
jgi:hypothetical protein